MIANAEHRFVIAEQLRASTQVSRLVLEPVGRNTAPAAAVAALLAMQEDPDALILLMPADHSIGDTIAFEAAVRAGVEAARKGSMVLFGIRPTAPVTGYGISGSVHRSPRFRLRATCRVSARSRIKRQRKHTCNPAIMPGTAASSCCLRGFS